jgi:hypothetical protein
MLLRRFSAVSAAVILMSAMAFAQAPKSVAGSWDGTLSFIKDGQVMDTDPVHLILKQDGVTVTGSGGPNAERQFPISKVKYASAKDVTTLAFEVDATTVVIAFDLKLTDGMLKGTATGDRRGEKQTATVELKLVK